MSADLNRLIAFSMTRGISLAAAREIESRVGSVDAFFETGTRELWEKIGAQKAFCTDREREATLARARAERDFTERNSVGALYYKDENYSRRLAMCDDAPVVIYRLGKCDLNAAHTVAIVGTRRCTAYGSRMTAEMVRGLSESIDNLVIVSGLAYGIDVAAHRAALEWGVPTVGVVAHGLKTLYPADHRDIAARMVHEGGALVTEYPSDAPVHRGNFLARNRIIAGMSDVTVVVESDSKGGAMVTASLARAYNRETGAVPGRATDRYSLGPNALIHNNAAFMVRDADDLVEAMNWMPRKSTSMPQLPLEDSLQPGQQQLIDYLRKNPSSTVNDMVQDLHIPYAELSGTLMDLEMSDAVTALPGGKYQVNL